MKYNYCVKLMLLPILSSTAFSMQQPDLQSIDMNRERDFLLVKSEIVNRLGAEYVSDTFRFTQSDLNMEVRRAEYLYNQQKMYNPYQYPTIGQLFYKKSDLFSYARKKIDDHNYWIMYANQFMNQYNMSEYNSYPNFGEVSFAQRFKEFLDSEYVELRKWRDVDVEVHRNPEAYLLHGPLHPHKVTGVDQLHAAGINGDGAKVIVWDCGFVDNCHVKFTIKDEQVKHPEEGDEVDRNDQHGTHVAGTIGADAASGDYKGVAFGAEVLPVEFQGVDELIDRIRGSDAKIISASFHYLVRKADMRDFDKLLDELEKNDRILVMASGNDSKYVSEDLNPDFLTYWNKGLWFGTHGAWVLSKNKALANRVLFVGSLKEDGQTVSRFSNLPGAMHQNFVFAPGENVMATVERDTFDKMSGTSMATPHVSGILSLMNKYYPQLTALELKDCLIKSCDRFWEDNNHGVAFKSELFGQGRVNAVAAFAEADNMVKSKAAKGNGVVQLMGMVTAA